MTRATAVCLDSSASVTMERATGFEPAPRPWQGRVLPLHHARAWKGRLELDQHPDVQSVRCSRYTTAPFPA